MNNRQIGGVLQQAVGESIQYSITTTVLGSNPSAPSATVLDITTPPAVDVTATVMPTGVITITGDVITLKPLTALTVNHQYQVNVTFTTGSNVWTRYFLVDCRAT